MDVKKVLREKSKKERNQVDEESDETKKTSRLTLPQKKIIKSLDKGKTTEEISRDLRIPLEEIKKEIENLQELGMIAVDDQKNKSS